MKYLQIALKSARRLSLMSKGLTGVTRLGFQPANSPPLADMVGTLLTRRLLSVTALSLLACQVYAQPTISIQQIKIANASVTAPVGYYTWNSRLGLTGAGWKPGETLQVHIVGPQNLAGVTPTDRMIATAFVGSAGNIYECREFNGDVNDGAFIPYNQTANLAVTDNKQIPRPGSYNLVVQRPNPLTIYDEAVLPINIAPDTLANVSTNQFDSNGWPWNRGGRDGWLGDHSPERADPEWISAWSEKPVGLYATIAKTSVNPTVDDPGANQPSFLSVADSPFTHYAHDVNMELLPDPQYMWTIATSNYLSETFPGKANFGKMECEWEVQNAGSPFYGSYERGVYGMPLWVMPTAGDRVYMVGRWVMDNGHPDTGDRTEIHPVRLLATMRQRNTAVQMTINSSPVMTRASQVDVYVSGHGGGANMYPDGLAGDLDKDGPGGGIISDVLDTPDLITYYSWGPSNSDIFAALNKITELLGWGTTDETLIKDPAGPSGLDWKNGSEFRPINDMDYDFDVPLPAPPAGATHPLVNVTKQPGNFTSVQEVITYTTPVNGLPTVAHFHIPYNGADTSTFAKTFKFYWDVFNKPGEHFLIHVTDARISVGNVSRFGGVGAGYWGPGPVYLWTDVCGQWASLTDANPGVLATVQSSSSSSPVIADFVDNISANTQALAFDVYLDYTDSLRVYTQGYAQRDYDSLFGVDVGKPVYEAGLDIAKKTYFGTGENQNMGGAIYDVPVASQANIWNLIGPHLERTTRSSQNESTLMTTINQILVPDPVYGVDFNVTHLLSPPSFAETGLPLNFGQVCDELTSQQTIQVTNTGETTLSINAVATSGLGFSTVPATIAPFSVGPGQSVPVTVKYSPIGVDPQTGSITFETNDPADLTATYALSGTPGYAFLTSTVSPALDQSVFVGKLQVWHVTISNPGTCVLSVRPSISGTDFRIQLPSSYYDIFGNLKPIVVPPGGSNSDLAIVFLCPSTGEFEGIATLSSNASSPKIKFLVNGVN